MLSINYRPGYDLCSSYTGLHCCIRFAHLAKIYAVFRQKTISDLVMQILNSFVKVAKDKKCPNRRVICCLCLICLCSVCALLCCVCTDIRVIMVLFCPWVVAVGLCFLCACIFCGLSVVCLCMVCLCIFCGLSVLTSVCLCIFCDLSVLSA